MKANKPTQSNLFNLCNGMEKLNELMGVVGLWLEWFTAACSYSLIWWVIGGSPPICRAPTHSKQTLLVCFPFVLLAFLQFSPRRRKQAHSQLIINKIKLIELIKKSLMLSGRGVVAVDSWAKHI